MTKKVASSPIMTRSQKSNRLIKNDSNIDADHNDRKKYQSKVKTKRHVDIDSVASISNNEINSEDEIEQSAIETSDESSVETDDQSEPVANQSDRKNEHKVSNRQKPEVASNKKYDSIYPNLKATIEKTDKKKRKQEQAADDSVPSIENSPYKTTKCILYTLIVLIPILLGYKMMHCFQKPQLQFEPFKPLIHQKYAHVLDATSSKVIQIAIKHGMKESSKGTTVIVLTYREVDQNNAMNFVNDLIDCVQNQLGLRGSAPPIIELKTIKSDSTDADEKMHSFLSQNQLLVLKSLESFNASHYNLLFKYMFTDPPEVPRGFLIYTLKLPNNTSIPSNPNPLDIERLVHSQLLQLWQPILTNNTIYAIFSRLSSNALLASKTNHL